MKIRNLPDLKKAFGSYNQAALALGMSPQALHARLIKSGKLPTTLYFRQIAVLKEHGHKADRSLWGFRRGGRIMHVVSELFGPPRRWVDTVRWSTSAAGSAMPKARPTVAARKAGASGSAGKIPALPVWTRGLPSAFFALRLAMTQTYRSNWGVSQKNDEGWDVIWRGQKIDVKRTDFNGRFLIWPLTKRREYETAIFDYLVLVKSEGG